MDNKLFRKTYPQDKVTDVILKAAKGPTIEKPKQIFLIVMESYDSWPLMDKYQGFHFADNLTAYFEDVFFLGVVMDDMDVDLFKHLPSVFYVKD